jgi:acyl-CoA synthetase (AMP-forming)/AMP-acid ligase II
MAAIQNWRVTDVLLVPTMIQMLVDNLAGSFDLSSLKNVLYGGSPISEALLDRATAAFPRVRFTQDYGMIELSAVATLLHWNEHVGEGRATAVAFLIARPGSGEPIAVMVVRELWFAHVPMFAALRESAHGPSLHSPQRSIIPAIEAIAVIGRIPARLGRAGQRGLACRHKRWDCVGDGENRRRLR